MNFDVISIPKFDKQVKQLVKKYPSLKNELAKLNSELATNPKIGKSIGNSCYKIRIPIASKGRGKSGGGRIITHVHIVESVVYLLSIYDKSVQATISDQEIDTLLKELD